MLAVRITIAPLIAAAIAAAPYLAFGYFVNAGSELEAGVPSFGALMLGVVMVGALLAMIFLSVARIGWKMKSMVVREHLCGWPVGIACLFFLVLAAPSWSIGVGAFVELIAASSICASVGMGAAAIWLRLSYQNEKKE